MTTAAAANRRLHVVCWLPRCMTQARSSASAADEVSRLAPAELLWAWHPQDFCAPTKHEAHLEAARSRSRPQLRAQDPHKGALVRAQQVVRHRDVPLQRVDLRRSVHNADESVMSPRIVSRSWSITCQTLYLSGPRAALAKDVHSDSQHGSDHVEAPCNVPVR